MPVSVHGIQDERGHYFFILDDAFVDDGIMSSLSGSAVKVYLAYCRMADKTSSSWPSAGNLMRMTGLSKNTILSCVDSLVEAGLIEVKVRYTDLGDRDTNKVTLKPVKGGSAKIAPGVVQKLHQGSAKIAPEVNTLKYKQPSSESEILSRVVDDTPKKPQRRLSTHTVPDDWELTDLIMAWAAEKGFTAAQIKQQSERFRLHEFKVAHVDWDRAFMRWMTNGRVEPETVNGKRKIVIG